MIGDSSLLAAILTVGSVVSLSLLAALCLRCKKKSIIIHEEHQVYDPQTFQRGGSRFAVTQSKTVTRANQIISTTLESQEEFEEYSNAAIDDSDYQNVSQAHTGSQEHTYVAPLPITVYQNQNETGDQTPDVYANIDTPFNNDDDDYENAEFLEQVVQEQEDDEPDYVNENG
ncbi:uncharacterized protein LOC141753270 [Sebastes fasciatus]|uniref:uncharacterized protein LOC141753270 n=1 Tax=Sebastes fasciatus TaxID=394691 RepID=UPI003D9DB57B